MPTKGQFTSADIDQPQQRGGAFTSADVDQPTDTRNDIQKSFDVNTTPNPNEPLLESGLKSIVNTIGSPFIHPRQTLQNLIPKDYATQYKEATSQPKPSLGYGTVTGLGQFAGNMALGEAANEGIGAVKNVSQIARRAAIGDPDAAALRALNVPAKSPRVQSTINAVQRTRPYVTGAKNLEDLQSRISPSKSEVFDPYQQAVGNIGNRPVRGPSGPTTVGELEAERQQTSALNRELKSRMPNPEAVRLAEQKGMGQAQMLQHERNIKSALDPEIASTGINPKATRATYGGIAKVGEKISGRSTIGEESQPYGLGKLSNINITKPLTAIPTIFEAGRDIAAGRPLFSGKPTDVAVRDAFRYGGPKPDLGTLRAPNLAAATPRGLPAPAIGLGAGPQPGGTPAGYRPPPFYADTTAMRTGRLLPAPPIELGGRVQETAAPPFYRDTTPLRTGRLLGEPSPEPIRLGGRVEETPPPPFRRDTTPLRKGRLLGTPPIELGGRTEGAPPPTFRHDTTPMRQGRLLPEPSKDVPLSSHADIFPEQKPGSALLRRKTIEGKK